MKIIDHMRRCTEEYSKVTGLRFGVLQTPAESTCHRLALIDRKMFGDRVVVQGDRLTESIYYTNNSHVVPSANIPLGERIKIESSFHPLTRGGAILHVWLGEANPSPEALFNLTKRIASGSLVGRNINLHDYELRSIERDNAS